MKRLVSRICPALALAFVCAVVLIGFDSSASARPLHGKRHLHHHHQHHSASHRHHAGRHFAHRHGRFHKSRRVARMMPALIAPGDFTAGQVQPQMAAPAVGGGTGLVATARSYIGGNPTGRSSLWCARFMNMVLEKSGLRGSGSDMARSFASYGTRVSGPQVGAIAVMSRGKRGGHVGVVSGIDPNGNPIVISGNHGRRVAESVYSKSRIYAYVMPTS